MKKNNYSYIGISLIILVFGIWAVKSIGNYFSESTLERIGKVPEFSFTDQEGNTITNKDYEGKVYVVEFFFTSCKTICPIMNKNMLRVQNEFYGNPNVGIASFTIDPNYDTPSVLKEYAKNYGITNPQWHFLTGEKEKIHDLANSGFNLYVGESTDAIDGFEHSGLFALIDQNGDIRSRKDSYGNPIIYYDGLEDDGIKTLIQDIKKLL
jgi:protein SCO1/2